MDTYSRHHIRIMKVALAIAIIRQKPDDMRVNEFTKKLALQFTELQGNWRHKALKLEQELLRMRQELVEYQLHPHNNVGSLEIGFLPWAPCGAVHENEKDSPQTVTCSTGQVTACPWGVAMETNTCVGRERIRTHVRFLSSVSSLMHANHHLSLVGVADLRTAVQDTVVDAMKALSGVLESFGPIPSYQSLEAVVTTVRDTIQSPLLLPFESELLDCCEGLVRSLVKHLGRQQGKDGVVSLQSALCTLCSFPRLFSRALGELVDQVSICSEVLKNGLKDVASVDSGSVGTLAATLTALEALLSKYTCSQLVQGTRSRLLEKLESSLLGLAVAFPLFSYAVWRLAVYLQPQLG